MKAFVDKDSLPQTETAKHLFHTCAEKTPLLDYHCHLDPRDITKDRPFDSIAQV